VTWAVRERGYSQRRACGLVGLHPKTYRYASTRPDDSVLRMKLKELASQRRRFSGSAAAHLARRGFCHPSTTKYLAGHSDVVGGAVIAARSSDVELLAGWANIVGTTGAPFDAHLTLRGLRTLFPRVESQQANAMGVARFLTQQPTVADVYYPGLETDPGHAIASAQQDGFGAMLSFELHGGAEAVKGFVEAVEIFTLAESLGGVESLIAHPATMTHSGTDAEARLAAGISDSLVRLSIGLEAESNLIAGLESGFATLRRSNQSSPNIDGA
jgi:cystathionine gamma-synthase